MEEVELLEQEGFPLMEEMMWKASPKLRVLIDPAAGLTDQRGERARGSETDEEFDRYVVELSEMTAMLDELRQPWLQVAPADDPMRYDEATFRSLESMILLDLGRRGAASKQLKEAHCLKKRRSNPPTAQGLDTAPKRLQSVLLWCETNLVDMKKGYIGVLEAMRADPGPEVIATFESLHNLLETLSKMERDPYRPSYRGVRICSRAVEIFGGGFCEELSVHALQAYERGKDRFPRIYEGTPGQMLVVRLRREVPTPTSVPTSSSQGAGCDAAGTLLGMQLAKQPLPELNGEEVEALLKSVICEVTCNKDIRRITGFASVEDDFAQFFIVAVGGREAHFVGRQLSAYYIEGPDKARYELDMYRRVAPETTATAALEQLVSITTAETYKDIQMNPKHAVPARGKGILKAY
ncbi:MAG: hypothetical protein QGH82_00475, partial [Candidatus Woesearchaeota archaeon]|nr:hypothetical protein [Candidatus Woesearchaeota archaeon]